MRPSSRRELAKVAVKRRGVSVALACRAFGISESCYRYEPILSDENALIADWLESLTKARKNWGFGSLLSLFAECARLQMEP